MNLTERINALIDRHFGGAVAKAGRAWGIPQPVAHRLAAGITESPHAKTLGAIAKYHGTTVEWLQAGDGPSPLVGDPLPMVEWKEFRDLVQSLGLSDEAKWAMLSLTTPVGAAYQVLCRWGVDFQRELKEADSDVVATARDAYYRASALHHLSWAYFLEGLIKAYGIERVREKLESELLRVRLGFHPVAIALLGESSGREAVEAVMTHFRGMNTQWAPVLLIDNPLSPGLDAVVERPQPGRPRKSRPPKRRSRSE